MADRAEIDWKGRLDGPPPLDRLRAEGRVLPEPPAPPSFTPEEQRAILEEEFMCRMRVPRAYSSFRRHMWQEEFGDSPTPWPTKIDAWADEWCLLLIGPTGTGKTCAAVATAVAFLYEPWARRVPRVGPFPSKAAFVNVVEACSEIRRGFISDGRFLKFGQSPESYYSELMATSPLLILDELGGQPSGDNWQERVDEWIYVRHLYQWRTIFTANSLQASDGKAGDQPEAEAAKAAEFRIGRRNWRRLLEGVRVWMGPQFKGAKS